MTLAAETLPLSGEASFFAGSALVSVADHCGVGCRFCFRADRGSEILTKKSLARYLSRLHEIGVRQLCFTGGEPTDHPDFVDLCRLSIQFGILPSVVTSARTDLQRSRLQSASRFLTHVTVSADSANIVQSFNSKRTVETAIETLSGIDGPTKSLHLIVNGVTQEEAKSILDQIAGREIMMEISPLFSYTSHSRAEKTAGAVNSAQWRADLSALRLSFELSSHLETFHASTASFMCERSRVYVSADGTLRWCPYDREPGVSLKTSRREIREFLSRSLDNPTQGSQLCQLVCRSSRPS